LKMAAMSFSETSVVTRLIRSHNSENGISHLHSVTRV
jgi:hypothetical protein